MRTIIGFVTILGLAGLALAAPAAECVSTIDMQSFTGAGVTVSADKVELTVGDKKESLARADVAEIILRKADDLMGVKGQAVLLTDANGQLAVSDLTGASSKLTFGNKLLGKTEMSLDAARTIILPDARLSPLEVQQRVAELKLEVGTQDMIVVAKSDQDWPMYEGSLKTIDAQSVTFSIDGANHGFAIGTARSILLAALAGAKKATGGVLTGADGSMVGFDTLTMDKDNVEIDSPIFGKKKLARADVAAIRFFSDRVVNLGDVKPASVKEVGFFEKSFPHRVNRCVSGSPLTLGGQVFATGLGLHSQCELVYKIDGAYATFAATIGIDDAVKPAGDATITFLGDGKELEKPIRLTGKDKPQVIRVKLKDVKEFTIRVDFGEDKIDVSDHVDLGGAKFIK